MDQVGILDLGSARVKFLFAERSKEGNITFHRYKRETFLAGKRDTQGRLPQETGVRVAEAAQALFTEAAFPRSGRLVCLASEVFRTAGNGSEILKEIEQLLSARIRLLTPAEEGHLFYRAVKQTMNVGDNIAVTDIGGGSIQVIFSDQPDQVISAPLGTFALERTYQRSPDQATREEYEQMRQALRSGLPALPARGTLIVGSTCMQEFFQTVFSVSGADGFTVNQCIHFFEEIATQPYVPLESRYPKSPMFMHGADKVLVCVLAVAEALHAERIIPTDESLGTGLARLVLETPDQVKWLLSSV